MIEVNENFEQLGKDAKVPLEMCTVLRGQFANRDTHLGPNQVSEVLRFATRKPVERMNAIKQGIQVIFPADPGASVY